MSKTRFCPNCQETVTYNDVFCSNCGLRISAVRSPERHEERKDINSSHGSNLLKDFGTYLLWGFLMIIATVIPAVLIELLWETMYHSWCVYWLPSPSDEGFGIVILFSGLMAGLLLLRCIKRDMHRSRFFGVLSGIVIDMLAAFIMIVFPEILNANTFDRAFIAMVALGLMIVVAIYVVGPYAIALNDKHSK